MAKVEPDMDLSNGWEAIAKDYHHQRRWQIGAGVIQTFTQDLKAGQSLLDLGCGSGGPHIQHLLDRRIDVYAIDAAPSMIVQFQQQFPTAKTCCETAEHSNFYQMQFDAILAVGLIFLLPAVVQHQVLAKMAHSLRQGGKMLFSCPVQVCQWQDLSTGLMSESLGKDAYQRMLNSLNMVCVAEFTDEGANHYYCFAKNEVLPV